MLKYIRKIKKSIWLYPALYSFLSLLVAIVVINLDRGIIINLNDFLPSMVFTGVDLAKNILIVIAGSLLTMTTFTFSSTLVVLTTYASQFSPRTVENFLMAKKTMRTLGIFTGGFIYAITTLLFMRQSLEDRGLLAATIGILFSIFCLIVFIRFIQHVGSYIQTNNLIKRLAETSSKHIHDYKKIIDEGEIEKELPVDRSSDKEIDILAGESGYFQWVSFNGLEEYANRLKAKIIVDKSVGKFVDKDEILFSIAFPEGTEINEDEIQKKIRSYVTISNNRSEDQDFQYSMQKISEIGTRALSPGINDPNTAVHCVLTIGVLIKDIANLPQGYVSRKEFEDMSQKDEGKVYYYIVPFGELLFEAFHQIVYYGRADFSTVRALFTTLARINKEATPYNQSKIKEFGYYIWNKMDPMLKEGMDGKYLKDLAKKIEVEV